VVALSYVQVRVTVHYHGYRDASVAMARVVDRGGVGRLEDHLNWLLTRGASSVLGDLTAVDRCDRLLLAGLDRVSPPLQTTHGQLHLQDLDPEVLSGVEGADPAAGTSGTTRPARTSPGPLEVADGHAQDGEVVASSPAMGTCRPEGWKFTVRALTSNFTAIAGLGILEI
jgi:hypothetical protein